jgi:hypothetical protein
MMTPRTGFHEGKTCFAKIIIMSAVGAKASDRMLIGNGRWKRGQALITNHLGRSDQLHPLAPNTLDQLLKLRLGWVNRSGWYKAESKTHDLLSFRGWDRFVHGGLLEQDK